MQNSEPESETVTTKRSVISAYGPLIAVVSVIIFALIMLFSVMQPPKLTSDAAPNTMATPPSVMGQEEGLRKMQQSEIDKVLQRTQGNWDIATSEEQGKFTSFSMGHGKEFYASQWKHYQEKEKAAKEKATPAKK
jgi:hypothetical protein